MTTQSLEGKVALIIGASSGIGEGIVEAIAETHPKAIVIAARRLELLQGIAERVQSTYDVETFPIKTDVTSPSDIDSLFAQTREKYGALDIVVNSAGVIQKIGEGLEIMSPQGKKTIVDTNYIAVIDIGEKVLPIFRKQNSGVYLTISSEASKIPYAHYEVYCSTKAGADMFMDSFNSTLREENIDAYSFAIGPGLIDTVEARANFPNIPESVWKQAGTPLDFARSNIIPALTNSKKYLIDFGAVRTVKTANAEDVE